MSMAMRIGSSSAAACTGETTMDRIGTPISDRASPMPPLGQANEQDGRNGNEIEVDVGKHWRRLILLSSPSIGFPE